MNVEVLDAGVDDQLAVRTIAAPDREAVLVPAGFVCRDHVAAVDWNALALNDLVGDRRRISQRPHRGGDGQRTGRIHRQAGGARVRQTDV